MQFDVRTAAEKDAEQIGQMALEFADYLRSLGDQAELKFDAATYLRDGFGAQPAFNGLVVEQDGEALGYLLYHFGYDVDYAARTLHVVDLYVRERSRGHGIGRALMDEAAHICRAHGGAQLFWSVYVHNRTALRFYERLGARLTRNLLFMRLDV